MQPALIQSYVYEFKIAGYHHLATSAVFWSILIKCDPKNKLMSETQTKYCSGTGMLLHTMWWTRPDIYNAVEELSCHMTMASKLH